MTILTVDVEVEGFYEWAAKAVAKVEMMSNVLKEANALIYNTTAPITPLKDGYLMDSIFSHSRIVSDYPHFSLSVEMTGIDNPTAKGGDYALLQHSNDFHHPIQGQSDYLKIGFDEAKPMIIQYLETDYMSALGL